MFLLLIFFRIIVNLIDWFSTGLLSPFFYFGDLSFFRKFVIVVIRRFIRRIYEF